MVYSRISIIYGIPLNCKLMEQILIEHNMEVPYLNNEYNIEEYHKYLANNISDLIMTEHIDFYNQTFSFPGSNANKLLHDQTSILNDTPFILLGVIMKEIYRDENAKCGKFIEEYSTICDDQLICSTCIKITENGIYDVQTMQQTLTQCETYCVKCRHDNVTTDICIKCQNPIFESHKTENLLKQYNKAITNIITKTHLIPELNEIHISLSNLDIPIELINLINQYYNDFSNLSCNFWYLVDDCFLHLI